MLNLLGAAALFMSDLGTCREAGVWRPVEEDMRDVLRSLVATAALTMVVTVAGAKAEERSLAARSFDVSGAGLLTIDSDVGSLVVRSGVEGRVRVDITCDTGGSTRREVDRFLEDLTTDVRQSGNNVSVEVRFARHGLGRWLDLGSHPRIHFEVTVPRAFTTELHTRGGSITVGGLDGAVRARTSGGSLRFGTLGGSVWGRTSGGGISLEDCKGPVDVHTSGGGISIADVDGAVDADTSGGSIHIERARGNVVAHTSGGGIRIVEVAGSIDATTSGGSIEASLSKQPTADCRLATSGGSVTVHLAPSLALHIDARGSRVTSDLPVTVSGTIKRGRLEGAVNGGGPTLTLRTSGGSVHIRKL